MSAPLSSVPAQRAVNTVQSFFRRSKRLSEMFAPEQFKASKSCLKYEQDSYEDLLKHTPKVGAIVKTAEGRGVVEEVNLLTGKLRVKMDKNDNVVVVKKDDIEVIKDSVIRLDRDEIKALKGLEGK